MILFLTKDVDFWNLKNRDIYLDILNTVLKIETNSKELKSVVLKVLVDIVIPCNNYNVSHYYLEKILEIKNPKKLRMLLNIYPFIKEYCKGADNFVFNQISEFEKLKEFTFDDNSLRKKLVLPIKCEEDKK